MTLLVMISRLLRLFCLLSVGDIVVHVFSSKLSSWKKIGVFCYTNDLYELGCVLDGAPHWLVNGNGRNAYVDLDIVCFDVTKEKFKELPMPIDEVEDHQVVLGDLGIWLCVVDHRLG